jgi:hypothetical protein
VAKADLITCRTCQTSASQAHLGEISMLTMLISPWTAGILSLGTFYRAIAAPKTDKAPARPRLPAEADAGHRTGQNPPAAW